MERERDLTMARLLHYVSGVRLMADAYDPRLWHFSIHRKRYLLRARGGIFVLQTEDGAALGTFRDWNAAVAEARAHAHAARTDHIPLISPTVGILPKA